MATKTLILRPTSVTAPDESLITLYPSDTVMADAHILIGEELADDASTYIQCANNSTINYYFSFTKPDDFKKITDISFFMRYGGSSNGSSNIALQMGLASTDYSLGTLALSGSAYKGGFGTIADIDKTNIITELNNATLSLDFYVQQTVSSSANKVSVPRVTQVYIEVTYESNKDAELYKKQNGEWILCNYKIYHRRNCKWNVPNFSTLQSNTKLATKEVE